MREISFPVPFTWRRQSTPAGWVVDVYGSKSHYKLLAFHLNQWYPMIENAASNLQTVWEGLVDAERASGAVPVVQDAVLGYGAAK